MRKAGEEENVGFESHLDHFSVASSKTWICVLQCHLSCRLRLTYERETVSMCVTATKRNKQHKICLKNFLVFFNTYSCL